jgi:uncharacterized membrane protein
MNDGNETEALNDKPVFEALLMPHRSLGHGGFVVLMALTSALCIGHGFVFLMAGAWPVFAFFGLDIVLLYGAFWLNYRSGRAREIVSVSRTMLSIQKITPSGQSAEHRFNPFWARFNVARHEEIGITHMDVEGEGRRTDVGSFLNPGDRESFARAFSGALSSVKR